MKKTKILVLAPAMVASAAALIGCGTKNDPYEKGNYTYNTYLSTNPKTWNTHDWENADESYITGFTEMGFYDVILNKEGNGYEVVHEMAGDFPVMVPSRDVDEADLDRYGYDTSVPNNYIWDIALNRDACWEDGTPITADDYIASFERQLNPKYVNFRADSYYSSGLVVANAERYFKQGNKTIEALYDKLTASGDFVNTNVCSDGYYYINLARYTPYVLQVFSNADETTTFYTVLNQYSGTSTVASATRLAMFRIMDACAYYCWKYVDHSNSEYKSDWDEVTSLSKVEEKMMNENIEIAEFSYSPVHVRSAIDKVVNDDDTSTFTIYSDTQLIEDLKTVVKFIGNGTAAKTDKAWLLPLFGSVYNDYTQEFDGVESAVGIKKIDDYKIRLFLKKAISKLDLEFSLSSNWLVNVNLYDKLTETLATGAKSTKYATSSVDNYMSYGPYKLVEYQSNKHILMVKNDKWYGYHDGNHTNQYMMTSIDTQIIEEHNTARGQFEKGNLDDLELTKADMAVYGNSSRVTTTFESYTQKISFNSDRNSLKNRQTNGKNKTVLANLDFRKGLSLSLDRNNFASQTTAGSKAFTGLLNDLYLSDVVNGYSYRTTPQGKSVYNNVYGQLGGDPYAENYAPSALSEEQNGYNIAMATKYLEEGLTTEFNSKDEGHLKVGDSIEIEFRVYDSTSETTIGMHTFIQDAFQKAVDKAVEKIKAKGTVQGLDTLKINVTMQEDKDYYNSAKAGRYDMIFSIWGGATTSPDTLMEVYCRKDFESTCEYGFKGKQGSTTLSIDINHDWNDESYVDNPVSKTYDDWYKVMTDIVVPDDAEDPSKTTEYNQKYNILAALETGIINRFEAIPLVARGSSSLESFKVEQATKSYVTLVGYGGIRFMKFNYTNSEWSSFLSEMGAGYADLYKA